MDQTRPATPPSPPPSPSRRSPWNRIGYATLLTLVAAAGLYLVALRPLLRDEPTEPVDPLPAPLAGASAAPSGLAMPLDDVPGWRQTFAEDFARPGYLGETWQVYQGTVYGEQSGWFDPAHVSVRDGMLVIGAWRDEARPDFYTTGGVTNRPRFAQEYGKFEVRFRMDAGQGLAYSLILWPDDPESFRPEVDIAEDDGKGRSLTRGLLHPVDGVSQAGERPGDYTTWHTAGLEWTPQKLVFTMDGEPWHTMTGDDVPDQPLTLALQSETWECGHPYGVCPDQTTPQRVDLQVDWVVAYEWLP